MKHGRSIVCTSIVSVLMIRFKEATASDAKTTRQGYKLHLKSPNVCSEGKQNNSLKGSVSEIMNHDTLFNFSQEAVFSGSAYIPGVYGKDTFTVELPASWSQRSSVKAPASISKSAAWRST